MAKFGLLHIEAGERIYIGDILDYCPYHDRVYRALDGGFPMKKPWFGFIAISGGVRGDILVVADFQEGEDIIFEIGYNG